MKKFSVLFVAAVVALSASAGVNFKASHALKTNKINTEKVMAKTSDLKAKATSLRVMTEQPAGELKSYERSGQAVYVSGGYLTAGEQSGNRSDIVFAEDGTTVYIKNILCGCGSYYGDSWVEGTLEGNEIHVPLGQSIYWSDSYQADVVIAMGTTSVDGTSLSFTVDDRAEEAVYVIDGETITLQGTYAQPTGSDYPEYEGYGLGCYWTDDDSFGGFNEWNTVLTEREPVVTPTVISELPEGCADFKFMRLGYCIYSSFFGIGMSEVDGDLYVAFNEDATKAYIQNPLWWHDSYGTWVEGDFDMNTGIISVPVGQYLSWSDTYEYGVQLMWGSTYVYSDVDEETGEEGYYMGNEVDERAEIIEFQVSPDFKTIDLLNCEGDVNAEFPLNYEATGLYGMWSDDFTWSGSVEFTCEGEHMGQLLEIKPVQPANPTADEWYDCGDETGYSKFYYTLPKVDVNGDAIDPSLLSYSIFIDNDELFTFPAEDYTFDLYDDITEVDYDLYTNAVDFGTSRTYFYRTNAEGYDPFFTWRIGIQVYYNVDGEKFASDIVYLEVFPHEVDPHMQGYWLVAVDANGEEVWYEMSQGANGEYTTTLSLDYDTYGYVYYDANTPGDRHNVDYYIVIDGVRYGAPEAEVATVLGTALDNELFEGDGFYTLPVGYNYNMGVAIGNDGDYYVYAAQAGFVSVDELNAGKTVANVRYFNVMGQEMAQPQGMTIAVTTYTDGTTSAVKVVK